MTNDELRDPASPTEQAAKAFDDISEVDKICVCIIAITAVPIVYTVLSVQEFFRSVRKHVE